MRVLIALLAALAAHAADPSSVAAEARAAAQSIRAGSEVNLPEAWDVETASRQHKLSTAPARELLGPPRTSLRRDEAAKWLEHVADELEPPTTESADPAAAREALSHILRQPTFRGLAPPSAWEEFKQRVIDWVRDRFARLFRILGQHPGGGYLVFWLVVAALSGWLVLLLVRRWRRDGEWEPLPQAPEERRGINWREWARAARQAANQGDARRAIHRAYWASVAYLETKGTLPDERARTPREVLRQLDQASSAREPLAALTTKLERHWYAGVEASQQAAQEAFASMEALGCRPD